MALFLIVSIIAIMFPPVEPSSAGVLVSGVAKADITPYGPDGKLWQEPFTDLNKNGKYDPSSKYNNTPEPYQDLNKNGKWDGPYMAGYSHNPVYNIAQGVHDPIWARAISLSTDKKRIVLVALDIVGLLYDEVEKIKAGVADLQIDTIIIASTHTHAGVDTIGLWGPDKATDGKDPRFITHIIKKTQEVIRASLNETFPVVFRFAKATPPVKFGHLVNDLRDPVTIDDTIYAVQVLKKEDLTTLATVINWSPHPETMGGSSSLISSDFPHFLRDAVENGGFHMNQEMVSGLGGCAIYFSGAVGGMMTPLRVKIKNELGEVIPERSWEKTEAIGRIAAETVIRALEGAEITTIDSIETDTRKIKVPVDNVFFTAMKKQGVVDRTFYPQDTDDSNNGYSLASEVSLISMISSKVVIGQIAAVPGELLPELAVGGYLEDTKRCWAHSERKRMISGFPWERVGAANPMVPVEPAIRDNLSADFKLVFGLANDELGYIIPANDFVFPVYKPRFSFGRDRCKDKRHYEETMSTSSQLAPIVTKAIAELAAEGKSK